MAKAPRRRHRWLWLGVLPALLLLGVVGVRSLLQPERLSRFLLEQASQATGLQLALSEPAGVGLWPDLHLELNGLVATAPGSRTPLLRAERVEAVLPWSALHSDVLQIRSLRLLRPELDWAAMQSWLATRESSDAPFSLPRIDAAVEVSEGRIAGDGWSLDSFALHLPALRTNEKTTLEISAALVRANAAPWPVDASIAGTPRTTGEGLRIDDLGIELRGIAEAPIAFVGTASWAGETGFAISLIGELPRWPEDWPALPLPPVEAPVTLALTYSRPNLSVALDRADDSLEAQFALGEIGAWADDPAAPLLPPLTGSARAERLQFGDVELRGVELRVEEDDDAEP